MMTAALAHRFPVATYNKVPQHGCLHIACPCGRSSQPERHVLNQSLCAKCLASRIHDNGNYNRPVLQISTTVASGSPFTASSPKEHSFRFWIDDAALLGRRLHCHGDLLEGVLVEAGGLRTGGPRPQGFMEQIDAQALGYNHMSEWDLLWSSPKNCMVAAAVMTPTQMVGALPGLYKVTLKREMALALAAAYGKESAAMSPLTFSLPDQLVEWAAWQAAAGGQSGGGWWVLKQHRARGMGLLLLQGKEALQLVKDSVTNSGEGALRPYVVAQQYVERPLLIQGRKSHLRLWLLVTGIDPLRAYLHSGGLVFFSTAAYQPPQQRAQDSAGVRDARGKLPAGHLTNHHHNLGAPVWPLQQLAKHLGPQAFQGVWHAMAKSAALAVAAGLGHMRAMHARVRPPPHTCFQLLGLDFLLDEALKPWLLEANCTPSLDAEHDDPGTATTIRSEKVAMLRDLVRLVLARRGPQHDACSQPAGGGGVDPAVARELGAAGGFIPLMPLFPLGDAAFSHSIQWQPSDLALRQLCGQRTSAPAWQPPTV